MKLSSKIAGGFGVVLTALLVVGLLGYLDLGEVEGVVEDLAQTHVPIIEAVTLVDSALGNQELAVTQHALHR